MCIRSNASRKELLLAYLFILQLSAMAAEPTTTIPNNHPATGDQFWAEKRKIIAKDMADMNGNINLVFIGDSITNRWRGADNIDIWNKFWGPHKALNLGVGGDKIENVLFRLQDGELEGYNARLFVVMVGTNNMEDSATDVAAGIKAILDLIQKKQPQAKILLLGIFPRGAVVKDRGHTKNDKVNKLIENFSNNKIHYMDIGEKFLSPDGSIDPSVMKDGLHPIAKGYQIWAEAIEAKVKELMS